MEELMDLGLVKGIGASNMTIPKLELLLRDCRIKPVVNEMECHPHFQQPALFDYLVAHGIQPIGYCPLGSPSRPARDRTEADTADMDDPVIVGIAQKYGVHPAVICIQWALQRGLVVIPFAVKRRQYTTNLQAALMEPLTAAEMEAIRGIDRNCRLIKGQVFTWEGSRGWEDLWDPDGVIAG
jgi:diketogulonate reductase-like aldo/keto reductase